MLYIADEVFFSGTAAEITPIRSIDRIKIGNGRRGPIAEKLQKEFFAIVNGTKPDRSRLAVAGTRQQQPARRIASREAAARLRDGHLPRDLPSDTAQQLTDSPVVRVRTLRNARRNRT